MAKRVSKEVPIAERIVELSGEDFNETFLLSKFSERSITIEMLKEFAAETLKAPIAERVVEFCRDNFNETFSLSEFFESSIIKEIWEKFADDTLIIVDGKSILQYVGEYPIVVYQCNESICYADILPEPRLNSFVLNITVSTGIIGKKFSVSSGKMKEEIINFDTIVYYEDPVGIKHEIIQYDICKFLLKKPKLVVSEEGVLVFFTEDEILATTDCQQYAWVRWDDIIENCTTIENIIAYQEYCEVTLIEGEDVYDEFGELSKKAPKHTLALNFNLKRSDHNMIYPKFTKKS